MALRRIRKRNYLCETNIYYIYHIHDAYHSDNEEATAT